MRREEKRERGKDAFAALMLRKSSPEFCPGTEKGGDARQCRQGT